MLTAGNHSPDAERKARAKAWRHLSDLAAMGAPAAGHARHRNAEADEKWIAAFAQGFFPARRPL